jgi:predicted O-linked N-acetylglucosamine transferase (SPINDLY family)
MDFRLTDPYLDPHGGDKSGYSERSARLEKSYWCYWPTNDEPPLGPPPFEQNGHITFGCLNNFAKVTLPTLQAWAKLLSAISNARLILHVPSPEHSPHVHPIFQSAGVDASRLALKQTLPSKEYFALYNQIDIALDPFPFGGGTTTCDALWMGVPVVSLAGPTAVSRAGVSLLSNVGLPELVARSVDQYLQIATTLASDSPRLKDLRQSMRTRMQTSPLMDVNGFTRNIEGLYRAAWKAWAGRASG